MAKHATGQINYRHIMEGKMGSYDRLKSTQSWANTGYLADAKGGLMKILSDSDGTAPNSLKVPPKKLTIKGSGRSVLWSRAS